MTTHPERHLISHPIEAIVILLWLYAFYFSLSKVSSGRSHAPHISTSVIFTFNAACLRQQTRRLDGLDNGAVIDYDNVYIGFVCSFSDNGDVAVTLTATGGTGIHIVNLYPLLDMS